MARGMKCAGSREVTGSSVDQRSTRSARGCGPAQYMPSQYAPYMDAVKGPVYGPTCVTKNNNKTKQISLVLSENKESKLFFLFAY